MWPQTCWVLSSLTKMHSKRRERERDFTCTLLRLYLPVKTLLPFVHSNRNMQLDHHMHLIWWGEKVNAINLCLWIAFGQFVFTCAWPLLKAFTHPFRWEKRRQGQDWIFVFWFLLFYPLLSCIFLLLFMYHQLHANQDSCTPICSLLIDTRISYTTQIGQCLNISLSF